MDHGGKSQNPKSLSLCPLCSLWLIKAFSAATLPLIRASLAAEDSDFARETLKALDRGAPQAQAASTASSDSSASIAEA